MSDKKCAFCNRENFEDRIIYENEWFFVIPTLGQFVPGGGYSLVIPKRHVRCVAELALGEARRIEALVDIVANATAQEWGDGATMFEHGIVGQTVPHTHMHILPGYLEMHAGIERRVPDAVFAFGHGLSNFVSNCHRNPPSPYLLWAQYGFDLWNLHLTDSAPPQILRSVAAEIVTGDATNGDWRNADPDVDKERMDETIKRLSPYLGKTDGRIIR